MTTEQKQSAHIVHRRLVELRQALVSVYTEREEPEFATFYNGFVEHGFSKKGLFESQAACRRILDRLAEEGESAWQSLDLNTDLSSWIHRTRSVAGGCEDIPCEHQSRRRPVGSRLYESLRQVDRWISELAPAVA